MANENADVPPVEILVPPLDPAAITSAAGAAIVVGLLAMSFRRVTDSRTALLGAYVAGLATAVWSVAADSLWQHGPAMLWIVAGTLLSVGHRWWSGLAFGAAVLTRPHTALVAAGNGLTQAVQERSLRPALQLGTGSGLGLVLLIMFNDAIFGSPSITGGYSDTFANSATSLDLLGFAKNVVLALINLLVVFSCTRPSSSC